MNALITTRTLAASAFVAAAAFSIMSFGNAAEAASNLSSCSGPSAKKVVDCCQRMTALRRPLWMRDAGSSCHTALFCKSAGGGSFIHPTFAAVVNKPKKLCAIMVVLEDNPSHETKTPPPSTRGTNPNGGIVR
jgi:hypothetical protein